MSRATSNLGLSELHRLCTAEVQDGSGLFETETKPPQHNLRHRLSIVVVLGKLRD